ncbi:serine/threonine protein kinase [Planomonospora sphaerica]|uniref:non-specific serine/threonine protein kinase n=1 Tax=Planomonospora sphaerica TaxID=161355 RepID=A0A161LHN7_9ACTN|nr:serine/threonine-protein kinase [Planomonospora sphaerica]GAT64797.1 serine/threonine protein kinase [Planomonospora sphaerica]
MTERRVAGRYHLLEPIGEGGMGVVWRAHDELLDRVVAVKEVRYRGVDEKARSDLNQRTVREAKTAGRLDHPSVIIVHDVVEEGGRPWIVMQLVRSRSLGETVRERGPLPPDRVAAVGLSVLGALRAAHAAGVLHRDVKPENVLLAHDGRVVLTDFGIASTSHEPGITRTGGMVGTPAFLPPERLHGLPATPESDLWSLGATLYAALEGRPPFHKATPAATMMAVLAGEPPPLTCTGPLASAVLGLLAKEPAARMGADEAEALLTLAAAGRTVPDGAPPPPPPSVEPPYPASLAAPPAPAPQARPPRGGRPSRSGAAAGRPSGSARPTRAEAAAPYGAPPAPAYGGTPPEAAHGHAVYGAIPDPRGRTAYGSPPDTVYGTPASAHPAGPGQPPHPGGPAVHHGPAPYGDGPVHPGRLPVHPGGPAEPGHAGHPGGPAYRAQPTRSGGPGRRGRRGLDEDLVPVARPAAGRIALVVGVPVLAVVLGVGGWLVFQDGRAPAAATRPTGRPAESGGATAPATAPPDEPTDRPTATPTPSARLPKGWRLYEDPEMGFSIAIPKHWTAVRATDRDRVEFRAPGAASFLWIESTDDPELDPVRHWEKVEKVIRKIRPGYRRIAISPLNYRGMAAADWEFTYTSKGVPTRVVDRGFRTVDGTPYAIYWESPEARWDRTYFDRFTETFQP